MPNVNAKQQIYWNNSFRIQRIISSVFEYFKKFPIYLNRMHCQRQKREIWQQVKKISKEYQNKTSQAQMNENRHQQDKQQYEKHQEQSYDSSDRPYNGEDSNSKKIKSEIIRQIDTSSENLQDEENKNSGSVPKKEHYVNEPSEERQKMLQSNCHRLFERQKQQAPKNQQQAKQQSGNSWSKSLDSKGDKQQERGVDQKRQKQDKQNEHFGELNKQFTNKKQIVEEDNQLDQKDCLKNSLEMDRKDEEITELIKQLTRKDQLNQEDKKLIEQQVNQFVDFIHQFQEENKKMVPQDIEQKKHHKQQHQEINENLEKGEQSIQNKEKERQNENGEQEKNIVEQRKQAGQLRVQNTEERSQIDDGNRENGEQNQFFIQNGQKLESNGKGMEAQQNSQAESEKHVREDNGLTQQQIQFSNKSIEAKSSQLALKDNEGCEKENEADESNEFVNQSKEMVGNAQLRIESDKQEQQISNNNSRQQIIDHTVQLESNKQPQEQFALGNQQVQYKLQFKPSGTVQLGSHQQTNEDNHNLENSNRQNSFKILQQNNQQSKLSAQIEKSVQLDSQNKEIGQKINEFQNKKSEIKQIVQNQENKDQTIKIEDQNIKIENQNNTIKDNQDQDQLNSENLDETQRRKDNFLVEQNNLQESNQVYPKGKELIIVCSNHKNMINSQQKEQECKETHQEIQNKQILEENTHNQQENRMIQNEKQIRDNEKNLQNNQYNRFQLKLTANQTLQNNFFKSKYDSLIYSNDTQFKLYNTGELNKQQKKEESNDDQPKNFVPISRTSSKEVPNSNEDYKYFSEEKQLKEVNKKQQQIQELNLMEDSCHHKDSKEDPQKKNSNLGKKLFISQCSGSEQDTPIKNRKHIQSQKQSLQELNQLPLIPISNSRKKFNLRSSNESLIDKHMGLYQNNIDRLKIEKEHERSKLIKELEKLNDEITYLNQKRQENDDHPQTSYESRLKISEDIQAQKKAQKLVKQLKRQKKNRSLAKVNDAKFNQDLHEQIKDIMEQRYLQNERSKQKKQLEIIDRMKSRQLAKINEQKKKNENIGFVRKLRQPQQEVHAFQAKQNLNRPKQFIREKPSVSQKNRIGRAQSFPVLEQNTSMITPELSRNKKKLLRLNNLRSTMQQNGIYEPRLQ